MKTTIALGLMLLVSAGAAPAATHERASGRLPAEWASARDFPAPADAGLRTALKAGHPNPQNLLRAQRALLAAPRSVGGSGLVPAPDPRGRRAGHGQVVGVSDPSSQGYVCAIYGCATPAGDLNGDGGEDVITVEPTAPPPITDVRDVLVARNGLNGNALWSVDIAPWSSYLPLQQRIATAPAGVVVIDTDQPCCGIYTTVVRFIDGEGTQRWSREFPSLFLPDVDFLTEVSIVEPTTASSTALFLGFLSGEITGALAATGRLLSLEDGSTVGEATALAVGAPTDLFLGDGPWPRVAPAPGLLGPGTLGFYAVSIVQGAALVSAWSAGEHAPLWIAPLDPAGPTTANSVFQYVPIVADFDGDGRTDVVVQRLQHRAPYFDECSAAAWEYCNLIASDTLDAVGSTGAPLWHRFFPFSIATIGGTSSDGADVRVASFPTDFQAEIRRIDGRTGTDVWATTYRPPLGGGASGLAVVCVLECDGDLDGDGLVDSLVTFVGRAPDGNEARVPTVAYAGSTGERLWERSASADPYDVPRPAAADVDGDGTDDLFAFGYDFANTAASVTVAILRGVDATVLGTNTTTMEADEPVGGIGHLTFAARLLGSDRAQIVTTVFIAGDFFVPLAGAVFAYDSSTTMWRIDL